MALDHLRTTIASTLERELTKSPSARVRDVARDVGKGTGLGLSHVYGFTKEFGGHVVIDTKVGVGTTVRLYIPRSTESLPGPGTATRRIALSATTGTEAALIVEDDESLLAITAEHLRELGYRLSLAGTATEALEILNGIRPVGILFSDVVLPGNMNGMQLAATARRLRPAIKVLLTSSYPVRAWQRSLASTGRSHSSKSLTT